VFVASLAESPFVGSLSENFFLTGVNYRPTSAITSGATHSATGGAASPPVGASAPPHSGVKENPRGKGRNALCGRKDAWEFAVARLASGAGAHLTAIVP
jgi:hypothetical protein